MGKSNNNNPQTVTAPPPPYGGPNPADYSHIMSGYQNFADTGGFSPEDLANIRARAVSPIRAVYANAQRELGRQRELQGGYSPGFQAAMTKMAREQSMSQADAAVNREADIAQQIREGKLAGLGGMLNTLGSGGAIAGAQNPILQPDQKKGFWGKFGTVAKRVGAIAAPIALSFVPGGQVLAPVAAAALGGSMGAGKGIGTGGTSSGGGKGIRATVGTSNVRPQSLPGFSATPY